MSYTNSEFNDKYIGIIHFLLPKWYEFSILIHCLPVLAKCINTLQRELDQAPGIIQNAYSVKVSKFFVNCKL